MDKDFHKSFTKCPVCGSTDRFLEQLGDEMKARGLARAEWVFHLSVSSGPVIDSAKANSIPIGSIVPTFGLMTDICMGCGCLYAVDIARGEVKKTLVQAPPIPMNRAERRRSGYPKAM